MRSYEVGGPFLMTDVLMQRGKYGHGDTHRGKHCVNMETQKTQEKSR